MATLANFAELYPVLFIAGVILLGLIVGSFLNVVIYRLPLMMEKEWQHECKLLLNIENESTEQEIFNLSIPHSHCPSCKAAVKAWQNIPLLSYALLGGRCGKCKTRISLRYPIIELSTGIFSGLVAWHFGASIAGLLALLLTWALITLTMIDADTQLLPDQITLPLLWLGLIANSFGLFVSLEEALWGAVFGYLSLWSVYWGFKLLTGKEGMGYGDFKLLAALGAWMGWQALPMIILLSSLVGAVIGIAMIALSDKDKKTTIPFGPYLAIAGWISLIWGGMLLEWYLH